VVFVLDGVLIGAGDGRYLAWAGIVVLAGFAPVALLAVHAAATPTAGLLALWTGFGAVFIGGRAVALLLRARTDRWLVVGA
jgi:MATE family, multidrug efflux pump